MQTRLPQVDKILRLPLLEEILASYKREVVVKVLRDILDELRKENTSLEGEEIAQRLSARLKELSCPSLKKLINGTGVVLNTNLGRAPISASQIDSLKELASGYCNLEIDLLSGKRGKRSSRIEQLLRLLTGAEASLAVNNNAAAVVLAVNCFALGKEVIVSRGELIEIGGSFRVPDIIEAAGGKLREIGTTNKTRLSDFEKAIGENTGLVMRCHRSNFELRGFTEETKLNDLANLCREKQIPLLEDLGSGVLIKLTKLGLEDEPTVEESIAMGCHLVCFSGDKLLGGAQAGIICGQKELLEKLHKHPLYRALRLDKISISLLERTLSSYLDREPEKKLPALAMMALSQEEIHCRVEKFIERFRGRLSHLTLSAAATQSAIGGGSLPGTEKPSAALLVQSSSLKASALSQRLRRADPPVIAITKENDILIDFRTVQVKEEDLLAKILFELDASLES